MQILMKDMVLKAFSAYNMHNHGADNNVESPAYPVKDWRMAIQLCCLHTIVPPGPRAQMHV